MPPASGFAYMMRSSAMRWAALVIIAFGMLYSAIGITSSHGFSELAAMDHGIESDSDRTHGHWHSDHDDAGGDIGFDHPHHSNDHLHDQPHALPAGFKAWTSESPDWCASGQRESGRLHASRLERPPRMDHEHQCARMRVPRSAFL